MKSVVTELRGYDWEDDLPLNRPFSEVSIYELHVGGFTRNPNSGLPDHLRGTFRGLVEKIPYLKDLGVGAVELMPVFQFDEWDAPRDRRNYWGYSPISFFAPHQAFASSSDPLEAIDEFRNMVKALHRAGIEVYLDVVYNHTAEGSEHGPTLCYRGLANSEYYILEDDRSHYANYSGTGNTLRANHSVTRRMIMDSLHYWVQEMHVDGFRFDLASVLSRDDRGVPLPDPPLLWSIESDPVLAGTKIIAEAWDAAGLYQVGSFIGERWKEWNGKFRDDVRAFLKGDEGMVSSFASRVLGSPDVYPRRAHELHRSVNFVTCHDGFTLNDLVSYNEKHNEANGEDNRDGHNHNLSWNCGVEGPSDDPAIEELRSRQVRNFLAVLALSLGTPMIYMGDEVRRSQSGNNNAYCQDNELGWFDWDLVERNGDLRDFTKALLHLRDQIAILHVPHFLELEDVLERARLRWHGVHLGKPDWGDKSRSIALSVTHTPTGTQLHVMFNAHFQPLTFELPSLGGDRWYRVIDTALPTREACTAPREGVRVEGDRYTVESRSIVMLATPPKRSRDEAIAELSRVPGR
jgi:glycogen operon protein